MHFKNIFPTNWLKYTTPLYAASKKHVHSPVNKPNTDEKLMVECVKETHWMKVHIQSADGIDGTPEMQPLPQ